MPLTRRRTLAGLCTLLGACLTCVGCTSMASHSGGPVVVGPADEPHWRWPGEGALARVGKQPTEYANGPLLGGADGSVVVQGRGTPSPAASTGARWRWPGTSYAVGQSVSDGPALSDPIEPRKAVASTDGVKWRWPGAAFTSGQVVSDGPMLGEESKSRKAVTTTEGAKWRWPGNSFDRTKPSASTTSEKLVLGGTAEPASSGTPGGLRWRFPATSYSAGASANDSNESVIEQPAVEKSSAPVSSGNSGGMKWRWPGTRFQSDAAIRDESVQRVSGAVIASTSAKPSSGPTAGPVLEATEPGRLPVIASSYRPRQPVDTVSLEPVPFQPTRTVSPMVTDLSGARPVPIASTGSITPAAVLPYGSVQPAAVASTPLSNAPIISTAPTQGPVVSDTPAPAPAPAPAAAPMPTEKAPTPRTVPRGRSTIVSGPPVVGMEGAPPVMGPGGPFPARRHGHVHGHGIGVDPNVPKEFHKQALPPYVVEPPDVLLVESTQKIADQPIRGQHLVRPDGTIGLGIYGSVFVSGMTLDEARAAIATQLALRIKDFDIKNLSVDVVAYNSKVYYIITDGGGYGEQVYRVPVTGNETVLDALGQINGLPPVASKKNIWVARATPGDGHHDRPNILPVDWKGITQRGSAATNYQVYPGDRVYVKADPWIRADSFLSKRISPIERILGVTLLGSTTVNSIRNGNNNSLGGGGVGF